LLSSETAICRPENLHLTLRLVLADRFIACSDFAKAEEHTMSDHGAAPGRSGMPEKIGDALGAIVILVIYVGIAWMVATASGIM
jgi:hypothetical protein